MPLEHKIAVFAIGKPKGPHALTDVIPSGKEQGCDAKTYEKIPLLNLGKNSGHVC